MKLLAVAPAYNKIRKDATAAFQPESAAFLRFHGGGQRLLFNNNNGMGRRWLDVKTWLTQCDNVDCFALFCHGWKDGVQIGLRTRDIPDFAATLKAACTPSPVIALYCCDTARDNDEETVDDAQPGIGGDGGFADMLRDELVRLGVRPTIFAHSTAGHTTSNPFVRRFDNTMDKGGLYVVDPGSSRFRRWRLLLREHKTLRFQFPFMTQQELDHLLTVEQGVV